MKRAAAERTTATALAAGLVAVVALTLASAAAGAVKHDWTRFGYDAARSGSSTAYAGIAAGDLAKLKRQDVAVPGTVDSSPLYLHDVTVAGKRRDVFLASTSYGRAFALDADTGTILWTYTPPSYDQLAGGKQITVGSPVVDPRRGFMYVPVPDGTIRKLSVANGNEVVSESWPATITLDAKHEKISASLNLAHGFVMATTAGFGGDIPPYQGHVALVNRDTGVLEHVFNSLCARRHYLMDPTACRHSDGGIWGRSGVVVVPGSRQLMVATGNGDWNGSTNWGDSVLRLAPDATKLLDSWTSTIQAAMNQYDFDVGSTSPALLRSGNGFLAVQGAKDGNIRLIDVANMNGHGGHPCACLGGELQTVKKEGNDKIVATPAAWRHDDHSWTFVTTYHATTAFRLSGSKPKLHKIWDKARAGSSPVIAGGLMYVYDPVKGGVAIYDPVSGRKVGELAAAPGHWNSPIVADGRIAVPVGSANDQKQTGTITIYRKP